VVKRLLRDAVECRLDRSLKRSDATHLIRLAGDLVGDSGPVREPAGVRVVARYASFYLEGKPN